MGETIAVNRLRKELAIFVVIGDLSIVESYWLVVENSWFLSGHLGGESEKTSGVLCALTGLYPSPQVLSVVFG